LPDGSKVWLNASSSLRYPSAFAGNERKVELLSGEAYFEVEHNKAKPFKVVYNGQTIEDLGTQFDINTYKDEGYIKTTLLQGSIRLSNNGAAAVLKPGQQALTQNNSGEIVINETNAENAAAWKDGKFRFDNASLNTVMNELQRWYNVDVKFEGNIPDAKFSGGTPMNSNLSEVLKVLELNGIHFRIEGRTIIVYP
jgi:transmembrane sensor